MFQAGGGTVRTTAAAIALFSAACASGSAPQQPTTPARVRVSVVLRGDGSGRVSAAGALDCPGAGAATVDAGSSLVLTALPDAGSRFGGFTGECGGGSSCTLSPVSDVVLEATFLAKPPQA